MLSKTYEPARPEEKWARLWQEKKVFSPGGGGGKKTYTIVIPPPNITGALHMGHALNNTLQDVLIRYKRMTGFSSYWVPGTDHGGIATQNVMEKKLKAEGKNKEEMGREKFLKIMWGWQKDCGGVILSQLKKLGCALDVSEKNVRFTMDAERAEAVRRSFLELWRKNRIYRGERIINWCPGCGTALSDIEIEYEEENSMLWHVRYPLENGEGGLVIATTRPETMLADSAVAVNPGDIRYKNLIGKKLLLPLAGRKIPVIADEAVEESFGTGALKVTPGHDPLDFEIGERHGLDRLQVISFEGAMINCPEKYRGKKAAEAKKLVAEDLKREGYLVKAEPYRHSLSTCYRCHGPIEPLISEQWFVKMKEMAGPAIEAAEKGEIRFHPSSWRKAFTDWLEKIQDWCVSRQIWWGHRIPVWYCAKCSGKGLRYNDKGELSGVSFKDGVRPLVPLESEISSCPDCGSSEVLRDPDVLDTWFSSALWPFSVFGWPQKTPALEKYYPTSALVTGYEILYLWVARMVMSGLEHTGKKPFSDVYIHGTVRDKKGKKMSKSLGNVVDPLEMMAKYGTDAMRFSLIMNAVGGKDIQFSQDMIVGGRNFVNKIYNASRFVTMSLGESEKTKKIDLGKLDLTDKWLLSRYNRVLKEVRERMDDFDASGALYAVYSFVWDDFCDWYIELSKPRLATARRANVIAVMVEVLTGIVKLLHPFMPYVTEEIRSNLKKDSETGFLLEEAMDEPDGERVWADSEKEMSAVMDVVTSIRTLRSQFAVPPGKKINSIISAGNAESAEIVKRNSECVRHMAKVECLEIGLDVTKPPESASAVSGSYSVFVPMRDVIDVEKEKKRLLKEKDRINAELKCSSERLGNSIFLEKAPRSEVEKARQRSKTAREKLKKIENLIRDLG